MPTSSIRRGTHTDHIGDTISLLNLNMDSSTNEKLVQDVFNNQCIVGNILDCISTTDLMYHLDLRLVNKAFRDACDGNIRNYYQNVKLEYTGRSEKQIENSRFKTEIKEVYINYEALDYRYVEKFFHFLANVAKVRVNKVEVKSLCKMSREIQQSIHDSIIKTLLGNDRSFMTSLVGMDDICYPGCVDCIQIGKECREYGPVQLNYITHPITNPHHFDKLIIADYLLDDLANLCITSSETKEQCLKALDKVTPADISCQLLQFNVSEHRRRPMSEVEEEDPLQFYDEFDCMPIPRELLELILIKWKVQSVILKFIYYTRQESYLGDWNSKDWLTGFRFNDRYDTIVPSTLKLTVENVELDLSDSIICASAMVDSDLWPETAGYQDTITNIRRIFPTDKIIIRYAHENCFQLHPVAERFDRLLRNIFKKDSQNLIVVVHGYSAEKEDVEFVVSKELQELPTVVEMNLKVVTDEVPFDSYLRCITYRWVEKRNALALERFIGRRCTLYSSEKNCTIEFNMMNLVESQLTREEEEAKLASMEELEKLRGMCNGDLLDIIIGRNNV